MPQNVIRKLVASFDQLEKSIGTAKEALLRRNPVPMDLMRRIASYEEVLNKQRSLTRTLCRHIAEANWEEVSRHIKLINGLSAMVHKDAGEVMNAVMGNIEPRNEDRVFPQ